MQKRYQVFRSAHGSVELFEVIADSGGTVIPVLRLLEAATVKDLQEMLKNMLTDVKQHGTITMDLTVDLEDDECLLEYSEDVVIDCYDKFNNL